MENTEKQLTIAVTGLNAIDSPGPGIAVIRGLRDGLNRPVRIIGLAYETLEPGIYMHEVVDKTYQIPYPAAGSENLLRRLRYIHEKENLQLIIPNFDAELHNFIKLAPTLKSMGIATFLPTQEQFDARDKINLFKFGEKHGLLVPRDKVINNISELNACEESFGYPLVVKGKFYDAVVAHTMEQAQKAFYKLVAKWGFPIIVQEFIKGTEINIAILGDGKGNAISIIPMRKLYITDKGKAWAGITLEDDALIKVARDFVEATNWKGGCELEIMRTDKNELYIMEINPRFPAWIYLTAAAGQNQPAALARMALGEAQPPYSEYEVGKIFIRYSWDHITDIKEFHQISGMGEL
ncbi:ATP-grasp domain-containing protein [Flavihumibacter stibioxidans]|uniref:Biotin carboxylase n=1 Tax=Flavihumibacter stibioxidans TaxID=1834163 RepID=A0ABR7M8J7_9BACT|nr:ATP-grasp domain-containing protein [Flavihumibacter stibioxidans]MBC6491338.1 biotin carboxylase [Flavihumibacter stibioxidans]